jgi:hypothetical protein
MHEIKEHCVKLPKRLHVGDGLREPALELRPGSFGSLGSLGISHLWRKRTIIDYGSQATNPRGWT